MSPGPVGRLLRSDPCLSQSVPAHPRVVPASPPGALHPHGCLLLCSLNPAGPGNAGCDVEGLGGGWPRAQVLMRTEPG